MLLIMKIFHRMCRNTLNVKTERWSMNSEYIIIEWFGSEKTFKDGMSNPPAMNLHYQISLHVSITFLSLFLLLLHSSWLGQ